MNKIELDGYVVVELREESRVINCYTEDNKILVKVQGGGEGGRVGCKICYFFFIISKWWIWDY